MIERLSPPIARCTACGAATRIAAEVNQRCERFVGSRRKRCDGMMRSASAARWIECTVCKASGQRRGQARCELCSGEGWHYVPPH